MRPHLRLHHHAVFVGVFHYLTGLGNVLLQRAHGGIDHNGHIAAVHRLLAQLHRAGVIQMVDDVTAGLFIRRAAHGPQIGQAHRLRHPHIAGDIDRGALLGGRLHDALQLPDVGIVESRDGIALPVGSLQYVVDAVHDTPLFRF